MRALFPGLLVAGTIVVLVGVALLVWVLTDPDRHDGVHKAPPPVGKHRLDSPAEPGQATRLISKDPITQRFDAGHLAGCLVTRGVVMLSCPAPHDPEDVARMQRRMETYREANRLRNATP